MRSAAFALLTSLAACSTSPTTPVGPLGQADLQSKLPTGITVPDEAQLESHETTRTVCEMEDVAEGAEVRVRWKTFKVGSAAYVASVALDVTKPADALGLKLGNVSHNNANLDPGGAYLGMADVQVSCYRKKFRIQQYGGTTIQLKADGSAPVPGKVKVL